jgi:isopropylmalate/homocitrate/citramalate synthase
MGEPREQDVIYDWNALERAAPPGRVTLFDETLRDGIQSPSVVDPKIDDKVRILHLLDRVGVHHCDIGLPGAGRRAYDDVTTLAREIRDARLGIRAACAARTVEADIRPIADVSQKVGIPIEVMTFVGSSPIRWYAEDWDLDLILKRSAAAIDVGVKAGLPVTYVTEDTTRSRPDVLEPLFKNAIEHGAKRLCLCDTVGHATPDGVRRLIDFVRGLLRRIGAAQVGIDWHGHNDRGLGLENSLWAAQHGADRIHGCVLGVGERVGNAALDQILLNMKLLGWIDHDLSHMLELCTAVSRATRVPIPANYPLAGTDAFRTGTGVHAAAIIKAKAKGHAWLADRVYSGVPAAMFGKQQEIEIGHMSGESNVVYWLRHRNLDPEPPLVRAILDRAKQSDHLLSEDEVMQVVHQLRPAKNGPQTTRGGI